MNMDVRSRDKLIFGKYDPNAYMGGIRRFEGMPYSTLSKLIDGDYVDLNDAQNYAPSISELYEFASSDPSAYTFDGYVVSPQRSDYRVSIDSINRVTPFAQAEDVVDFAEFIKYADEFEINQNGGTAWWD